MVGHGSVVVTIDRWTLAEELWLFGEDAVCTAAVEIADPELIRVWEQAGEVLLGGKARSAREAAALAAVIVVEGQEGPLARKRPRPRRGLPDLGPAPRDRVDDMTRVQRAFGLPHAWQCRS